MGIFDKIKKTLGLEKKENITVNLYENKTLEELTNLLDSTTRSDYDLEKAYFKKLVLSAPSEGGFGGTYMIIADIIFPSNIDFIFQYGSHLKTGKFTGTTVQNHYLEFIKNYIQTGNTERISETHLYAICDALEDGTISTNLIEDKNSYIYNNGLYKFKDESAYKLKAAIFISQLANLIKYGLYKKDKDGNPTSNYITVDDIEDLSPEDTKDFIDYCQTTSPDD